MLKPDKEAKEYIDTICEWPPVEFDTWPFDNFEDRLKADDNIAQIARFIAELVTEDYLESIGNNYRLVMGIIRVLGMMNDKIENLEGFRRNIESKNLDGRTTALEKKTTRKYQPKYK